MWPFTSSEGKSLDELGKTLPLDLRGFFESVTPDQGQSSVFDATPEDIIVDKVLLREQNKPKVYDYEYERYKQTQTLKQVTSVNCSELQQKVTECFRKGAINLCNEEIKRAKQCVETQTNALKSLHFQDCISVNQCDKIRFIIDKAYVDSHGQFGETDTPEATAQFAKDVMKAFHKIWK